MRSLEGANCADLPAFVVDKYFDCDGVQQPFLAQTARAICSHCVVLEECRTEALTMMRLPTRGVIGGVSVTEIRRARAWRRYEEGGSEVIPGSTRPQWLRRSEASELTEQARLERDPDEP